MEAEAEASESSTGLDTVTEGGGRAGVEGWRVGEKRLGVGGMEEGGQLRPAGSLRPSRLESY